MGRLTHVERENCLRLINEGMPKQDVADLYNVHKSTIARLSQRVDENSEHAK